MNTPNRFITEHKLFFKAISIANKVHEGQVDKAGKPYMGHIIRVAQIFGEEYFEETIAALLHDVVEDSLFTLNDLRNEGIPEEIVVAVDHVTKRPNERKDYYAYINRIKNNLIATHVKLSDLFDNLDLSRLSNPEPKDFDRLNKYMVAYKELLNTLSKEDPLYQKFLELARWKYPKFIKEVND